MITRRTLLKLVAAFGGAGGFLGNGAIAANAAPVPDIEALADKFIGVLSEPRSATELGRAAHRCGLCESGPGALKKTVDAMLDTLQLDRRTAISASREQLRRCLAEACKADFAAGRTDFLDGWLLSKTELRMAAIAHTRYSDSL